MKRHTRYKPTGWRGESYRHYLAAKGISTKSPKRKFHYAVQKKTSSERMKELWEDPEFRNKIKESSSERMKELWQDPEFRKKRKEAASEMMNERWQDPEFSKEHKKRLKELWQDPEFRKKHKEAASEMMKEKWKDPDFRNKQKESSSEIMKENWKDPEFRDSVSTRMKEQWQVTRIMKNPDLRNELVGDDKIEGMRARLMEEL